MDPSVAAPEDGVDSNTHAAPADLTKTQISALWYKNYKPAFILFIEFYLGFFLFDSIMYCIIFFLQDRNLNTFLHHCNIGASFDQHLVLALDIHSPVTMTVQVIMTITINSVPFNDKRQTKDPWL